MGQGLILVHSKYGAAQKYAGWLKDKTGCPVLPVKQASREQLAQPDTVILIGGVYASGIGGIGVLRKHWALLDGKKLGVFAVGASPYEERNLTLLKQHNLRPPLEQVPCFYGRGIWDLQAMSLVDRTMCRMLQKSVAKKPEGECQSWELALREAGEHRTDWTHPNYLQPVLEWLEKNSEE